MNNQDYLKWAITKDRSQAQYDELGNIFLLGFHLAGLLDHYFLGEVENSKLTFSNSARYSCGVYSGS